MTDTPIPICCSKCGETKTKDKFIKNRNVCKECSNFKSREKYNATQTNIDLEKECRECKNTKPYSSFIKNRNLCKDCNNQKRKMKYQTDEEHRLDLINKASDFKHNKVLEKRRIKEEEIGIGNKKCSCCYQIKPYSHFRHNRLKCRHCERDDPIDKFKRVIRTRIYICLKNKYKHTIQYLGCNYEEYVKWMLFDNDKYTIDNHGKEWHIDHVIPLCNFVLENETESLIAFNWRNTTPLSKRENLSKNKKIIAPQIEQHWKKLLEYHKKNNIEMPQEFICLFAKYLVAGTPLEPSLPLLSGNLQEEHG